MNHVWQLMKIGMSSRQKIVRSSFDNSVIIKKISYMKEKSVCLSASSTWLLERSSTTYVRYIVFKSVLRYKKKVLLHAMQR